MSNETPAPIAFMDRYRGGIERAIPATLRNRIDYASFRTDVALALRQDDKLGKCTPESVWSAVTFIARLGLSIGAHEGQAYLIPYNGRATAVVGAQGRIELAYRSGRIRRIVTQIVRERDEFDVEFASGAVVHRPYLRGDPGDALFAWAGIWLTDQPDPLVEIMHRADIDKIRSKSKSPDSSAWKDHFNEMWRRSCLNRALKRAPKSRDLAESLAQIAAVDAGAVIMAKNKDAGEIEIVDVPREIAASDDDIDARAAEHVGPEPIAARAEPVKPRAKAEPKPAPIPESASDDQGDDDGGLG